MIKEIKIVLFSLISIGLFLFANYLVGPINSRLNSFIYLNIISILTLTISAKVISPEMFFKVLFIIFLTYMIRFTISHFYWLNFFYERYFDGASNFSFNHLEYIKSYTLSSKMANYSERFGFFAISKEIFFHKNIILHFIISKLYYFNTSHPYNFSVFNNFIVSLSSLISFKIAQNFFDKKLSLKYLFIISLLPLNLIISTIFRDYLGNFFVILSIYICFIVFKINKGNINQKTFFYNLILIASSCFLISLHRPVYFVIPILLFLIFSFKLRVRRVVILFFLSIILYFILFYFDFYYYITNQFSSYINNLEFSISIIFKKLLLNLVGPFPWRDYLFTVNLDDSSFLHPVQYFSSLIFFACLLSIFFNWSFILKNIYFKILIFTFSLFFISSLFAGDVHLSYYHNVLFLLIPMLIYFKKTIFYLTVSIIFYIISNILIVFL